VSDASSAGIGTSSGAYGKTCRKDVLRGVDVPVVPGAAGRARPVPRRKAQRGEHVLRHREARPAREAARAPLRLVDSVPRDHPGQVLAGGGAVPRQRAAPARPRPVPAPRQVPARRPVPAPRPVPAAGVPPRGRRAVRGHPAPAPLRLTRRGRLVVTAAAALLIAAISMAAAGAVQAAQNGHRRPGAAPGGAAVAQVVVRPGQSLWTIAENADPAADARVVIQQIIQMNSLSGHTVLPGQTLWVPRG